MTDCIFCKIANKEIKSDIVYSDEFVVAFSDIMPQAPKHIVVIPKKHYSSIEKIDDIQLFGRIFAAIKEIVKEIPFTQGFRVVTNSGKAAGQTVDHVHFHVLSGRKMSWPPG